MSPALADVKDRFSAAASVLATPFVDAPALGPSVTAQGVGTARPAFEPVHVAIARRAAEDPSGVAAVDGDRVITHGELNRAANRLAWQLRELGVRPGERVAVSMSSGSLAVVAFLAVLKAGGAFVPLDPSYPHARRAHKLDDAAPKVLITQQALVQEQPAHRAHTVVVDDPAQARAVAAWPDADLPLFNSHDDLAYVIYTSGSTGKPKGVMVSHGALAAYVPAVIEQYALGPTDRVLQIASLAFDICIEEIFPTLAAGACLVHKPGSGVLTVDALLKLARAQALTVLNLPTAFWHELVIGLEDSQHGLPPGVRLVVVGGEKASRAMHRRWVARVGNGPRFLNAYGPTETTVTATVYEPAACPMDACYAELPIGRPLGEVSCHVLDEHMNPVSDGEIGELYLGGPTVAMGYLNMPERTAQCFVRDPRTASGNSCLYRTGDRVSRLPSGDLAFHGRVDHQLKVRGFRIEAIEIEAALERHPAVAQAVVIGYLDASGNTALAAYCVAGGARVVASAGMPDSLPATPDLVDFLSGLLPGHMLPSRTVWVDALPLTPNGKLDREALTQRVLPEQTGVRALPMEQEGSALEQDLFAWIGPVFADALGPLALDPTHDFFSLGGHSLLAVRIVSRLQADRPDAQLRIEDLFAHPSPRLLAAELAKRWGGAAQDQTSLVRLNPRSPDIEDATPLYCLCGVALYAPLAQAAASDRPVYGVFLPEELDAARQGRPLDVRSLASRYLALIRHHRGQGPVQLAGVSFGATLAFEVAQQWPKSEAGVELLALLDPLLNRSLGPLAPLERLARRWRGWQQRRRDAREPHGTQPSVDDEWAQRRELALDAAEQAYEKTLQAYQGRVLVVSATGAAPGLETAKPEPWRGRRDLGWLGRFVSPDLGWAPFLPTASPVVAVDGTHLGILTEPSVRQVAAALRRASPRQSVEQRP